MCELTSTSGVPPFIGASRPARPLPLPCSSKRNLWLPVYFDVSVNLATTGLEAGFLDTEGLEAGFLDVDGLEVFLLVNGLGESF